MTKKTIALLVAVGLVLVGALTAGVGLMSGGRLTNMYIDKNGIQFGNYSREYEDHMNDIEDGVEDFAANMENFAQDMENLGNDIDNSFGGDYNYNQDKPNQYKGEYVKVNNELASFKNIDISAVSARIELVKSDKDAIEYNLPMGEKVEVCEVVNDTFTFKTSVSFGITIFGFNDAYIRVYYKDGSEFDRVNIKSTSGSVNVKGLTAKEFYVKSTSGSRTLSDIKATKVDITGTSGSVKLQNVTADDIHAQSSSGSVTLEDCTSKTVSAQSTSGSVKLYRANTSSLEARSASGSVYVQGELRGMNSIHSTSGSVKVHTSLSKDNYGYELSSVSGSCRVDDVKFEGTTGEGKADFIDAKTTSGSVRVFFNSQG